VKKSLILIAGLAIGTAAIGQNAQSPAPAVPDSAVTTTTTTESATDAPATAPAPLNAGDANRATPAESTVPAEPRATFASPLPNTTNADPASYPRCSRTVTDKCTQRR